MKYLIKHKKEFIITIVALVVAIADFLKVFGVDLPVTEDSVYAVVSAVMGVLVWFYNYPTSIEGDTAKIFLKEMKATRNMEWETVEEPEDASVGGDE